MPRGCRACVAGGGGEGDCNEAEMGDFEYGGEGVGDRRMQCTQLNLRAGYFTASWLISQNKIRSEIVGCEEHVPLHDAFLSSLSTAHYKDAVSA
jgi:hypothetical protein